jgi:hypothetical protein
MAGVEPLAYELTRNTGAALCCTTDRESRSLRCERAVDYALRSLARHVFAVIALPVQATNLRLNRKRAKSSHVSDREAARMKTPRFNTEYYRIPSTKSQVVNSSEEQPTASTR